MEVDIAGEHGRDTRDLLLLVHHGVAGRVALEVKRNPAGNTGQDGEEIAPVGLLPEDVAQRLDKPRARCGVSPGVKAWKKTQKRLKSALVLITEPNHGLVYFGQVVISLLLSTAMYDVLKLENPIGSFYFIQRFQAKFHQYQKRLTCPKLVLKSLMIDLQ